MTTAFQNFLFNRTILPEKEALTVADGLRCAADEEGFLVDQQALGRYRMAQVTSRAFGCGWVACYNALRLLGQPQSAAVTIRELESAFAFGGKLGTRVVQIAPYFMRKGFAVKLAFDEKTAQKNAASAPASIVYYVRGNCRSAHFVAFAPISAQSAEGEPLFRFYNAQSAPQVPRKRLPGAECSCYCAGGTAGDRRTLHELLRPEKAVVTLVISISPKR